MHHRMNCLAKSVRALVAVLCALLNEELCRLAVYSSDSARVIVTMQNATMYRCRERGFGWMHISYASGVETDVCHSALCRYRST